MTGDSHMSGYDLLRAALSLWWLRPENGLALAGYCLRGVDLSPGPGEVAADFACGDGVNSFFKCGGRFHPDFDLFINGIRTGTDAALVDVFDDFADDYAPHVIRRPARGYAYGLDHKPSLLRKAERLGFYDRTVTADLRDEAPIPDGSLDIAYCNSLYWVDRPDLAARHIMLKVRPGGRAVFDVMTDARAGLHFQNLYPEMPTAWQALLNRGRDRNNPGLHPAETWHTLFSSLGTLRDRRSLFPTAVAHIWNVGLRPLFSPLHLLSAHVPADVRRQAKAQWVDTCAQLLLPLLEQPDRFMAEGKAVRLQFVVERPS